MGAPRREGDQSRTVRVLSPEESQAAYSDWASDPENHMPGQPTSWQADVNAYRAQRSAATASGAIAARGMRMGAAKNRGDIKMGRKTPETIKIDSKIDNSRGGK